MRITLCQKNPIMGDVAGNTRIILDTVASVKDTAPDLVVFSELFLQGYPPRDLLEHSWFIDQGLQAMQRLCSESKKFPGIGILFGTAVPNEHVRGKGLSNSAVLISDGKILFRQDKSLLPSYDVFDETRYFDPAQAIFICNFKGEKIGITICEDAWNHADMWPRPLYDFDPVEALAQDGATILVNISGSPFHLSKEKLRYEIVAGHAQKFKVPFVFVNQVGGNDELVFDGNSMVIDGTGQLRAHIPGFQEGTVTVDTAKFGMAIPVPEFDTVAHVYDALVLGLKDYYRKCGFSKALVGLSGGIDSAVTAALAAAALGPANVHGVTMPSRYSSEGSIEDSRALAKNLGMSFKVIQIEPVFKTFLETMKEPFAGKEQDITEENMQARVRGNILMALSNKFGCLLLSTGNKSELAVGYCTLYGDMDGGLSVISDLPKTMVYKVAEYINRDKEIIPKKSISKAPSAELRPNQKDQDTLPPYDVLDQILAMFIEEGRSRSEIVRAGFNERTVDWVLRAFKNSEYKRRQAAPGLKVTPKAFGCGRRFPIAAKYSYKVE
jgi:NAD+ synthase (glutamine-hydrolysing)